MIITRVIIENFRIYEYKEFEFGENQLILITGANGFGKTTLIDAIEWCLTGDIARIKKCYDERNSKQAEKNRPENKKGIIKNSNCTPNDKIKVTITLVVDNVKVTVYREQKEDSLYADTEIKFEGEISDIIKDKIKNYAAHDKFYNYHICDTYKSYEFLNSKRQEVKEKFEDFIKPHNLADGLSKKLELMYEELKKDIESKSLIDTEEHKKELDLLKNELKQLDYPQIRFYEEENLNIQKENIEEIKKQQEKIKKCGYNVVSSKIEHVISYYQAIEKAEEVNKLIEFADTMGNDLNITITKSYYDSKKLDEIKNKIKIVSDEKQKIESIKKINQIDTTVQSEVYAGISEYVSVQKAEFEKMENEIKNRKNVINDKEKGNEIIAALSNLVVGRESFLKYRNEGNSQCPLCGSKEKFENIIKSDELAGEAQAYLDKSKSDLGIMKKEMQDLVTDVNKKFEALKKHIVNHFEEKLKILEEQKTVFNNYYNKTKDFFDRLKNLNISIDSKCIENLEIKKNELDKMRLEKDAVNSEIELIKNILTANQLSYSLENISLELLKKIQLDLALLIDQSIP
ncbi:AAA family ATPase, partial [Ruminiclostridium hungatei]|uniref:AAA family ATPase n=1 Tax=Ruminiclostridium hungatei TaxID=48256 RepID=UPI0010546CAB